MTMLAGAADVSDHPDFPAREKVEGAAEYHPHRAVQVRCSTHTELLRGHRVTMLSLSVLYKAKGLTPHYIFFP